MDLNTIIPAGTIVALAGHEDGDTFDTLLGWIDANGEPAAIVKQADGEISFVDYDTIKNDRRMFGTIGEAQDFFRVVAHGPELPSDATAAAAE